MASHFKRLLSCCMRPTSLFERSAALDYYPPVIGPCRSQAPCTSHFFVQVSPCKFCSLRGAKRPTPYEVTKCLALPKGRPGAVLSGAKPQPIAKVGSVSPSCKCRSKDMILLSVHRHHSRSFLVVSRAKCSWQLVVIRAFVDVA
eukprot:scaffold93465_cov30-Tisochrysis_lutea.AAC.6